MILDAIREFIGLLVEKQYGEAYDFLSHPPTYDWVWNPERIESVLDEYLHGQWILTPIDEAIGIYRKDCEYGTSRENDDIEGKAWHALPINGEWSDLFATFQIEMVEETLVLSLEGILVP